MTQGFKSRRSLIGLDAAEIERQANLARMAEHDEQMQQLWDESRRSIRVITYSVLFAVVALAGCLVIALPDLVAWFVGGPAIVMQVPR